MKKIATICSMLVLGGVLAFAQNNPELAGKVQKAAAKAVTAPNADVAANDQTLYFLLEETVQNETNGARGTYHAEYRCKAYVLDEHWYILAGTCGSSVRGDVGHNDKDEYTRHQLRLQTADGQPLVYKKNEHIMLLREEKHLPARYVNVLATSTPQQLFTLTAHDYTAVINTARFGLNKVVQRELKPKTIRGNSFILREGTFDLSGTATDPLFLIAPDQNTFLAAYNNAPMYYYFYDHPGQVRGDLSPKGDRSDTWFSLTEEDLKFIQNTLQAYPEDWARIKTRLFLDQTHTPYFE